MKGISGAYLIIEVKRMKNKLREVMEYHSVNQTELAEKVHVKSQTINHYVEGHRTPNVYMALEIAKALDEKVENIWEA